MNFMNSGRQTGVYREIEWRWRMPNHRDLSSLLLMLSAYLALLSCRHPCKWDRACHRWSCSMMSGYGPCLCKLRTQPSCSTSSPLPCGMGWRSLWWREARVLLRRERYRREAARGLGARRFDRSLMRHAHRASPLSTGLGRLPRLVKP